MMPIKIDGKTARVLRENTKLAHHIDRAIEGGEFEWNFKYGLKGHDDAWHPSSDCVPSVHELWEKAKGKRPKEKLSANSLKTFQVGHFFHAYMQWIVVEKLGFASWEHVERKAYRKWGIPYAPSQPYHWVQGIADIAPCEINNVPYLIDFKTQRGMDFNRPFLPDWCAVKYEAQINIYMDLFQIDRGLIVCINKDSPHDLKEFYFERNPDLAEAIYAKWKLVSDCLDNKEEPPKIETVLPVRGPSPT